MQIEPLVSEIHEKGWGHEIWYVNNDKYCLKRLCFKAGGQCSLHMHEKKTETWIIEKGVFNLTLLDLKTGQQWTAPFSEGCIIHVPNLTPHRLTAETEGVILEVSTPHFEEDSWRLQPGDSQYK